MLRSVTGARIKVDPLLAGCPERVVAILAPDRPGDRWCDAQQALFRVHERITAPELDSAPEMDTVMVRRCFLHFAGCALSAHIRFPKVFMSLPLQARLLVDPTQVGCILGKGGSVITELRRATGASVRVLSKAEVPACAERGDEMLQVRLLVQYAALSGWPGSSPTKSGGGPGVGRSGARAGCAATGF